MYSGYFLKKKFITPNRFLLSPHVTLLLYAFIIGVKINSLQGIIVFMGYFSFLKMVDRDGHELLVQRFGMVCFHVLLSLPLWRVHANL